MKYVLLLLTLVSLSFAGIGKITAINGKAYAVRGFSKVTLKEGSEIEKKDLIKTMRNTKLQIVFNDHTVISLGQKTDFKIDDYVFSKTKVKASFSVAKGIFKSITGRIGKIDHSKFKLKTKNATIGVRGTTFIGIISANKEIIACTSGEIVVQNRRGTVYVKQGEVTSIRGSRAPRPAKILNKNFIKKVKAVHPEINSDNIVIKSKVIDLTPVKSVVKENNVEKTYTDKVDRNVIKEKIVDTVLKDEFKSITSGDTGSAIDKVQDATEDVGNVVNTITSGDTTDTQDTTSNVVEDVTDSATNVVSNITEDVGSVVNTITSGDTTDTQDTTSNIVEDTTDSATNVVSNITEDVGSVVNTITSGDTTNTQDTTSNVVEDTTDSATNVVSNITEDVGSVVNTITSGDTTDTQDTTSNVVENVTDSATNVVSNITEDVGSVVSAITSGDSTDTQENWDSWNSSDMTTQDDSTSSLDDSTQQVAASTGLDALKEKVGGATSLHYEGQVAGDNILTDDNRVDLDVDLGHGSIDGHVKFKEQVGTGMLSDEREWDTGVSGNFDSGNRFTLNATTENYSGNGHVDLEGEHLETANGAMSLNQTTYTGPIGVTHSKDITFTANGGALSGN